MMAAIESSSINSRSCTTPQVSAIGELIFLLDLQDKLLSRKSLPYVGSLSYTYSEGKSCSKHRRYQWGGRGGRGGRPPSFETWGSRYPRPPWFFTSVFHRLMVVFLEFFAKFEFSIFDMFSQVSFKLFTFLKILLVVFQSPNIYYNTNWTNKHTYTYTQQSSFNKLCYTSSF